MAYSRYSTRQIFVNDDLNYRDTFFRDRDVSQIDQYETARYTYPTAEQIEDLDIATFRWESRSNLYKAAYDYYGRPELWWVIAWFNRKPTESHFKVGDIVNVPGPLNFVLSLFEESAE